MGFKFPGKFNGISVTRGWVGVTFPGKKRYITLEWPLNSPCHFGKGGRAEDSMHASSVLQANPNIFYRVISLRPPCIMAMAPITAAPSAKQLYKICDMFLGEKKTTTTA